MNSITSSSCIVNFSMDKCFNEFNANLRIIRNKTINRWLNNINVLSLTAICQEKYPAGDILSLRFGDKYLNGGNRLLVSVGIYLVSLFLFYKKYRRNAYSLTLIISVVK